MDIGICRDSSEGAGVHKTSAWDGERIHWTDGCGGLVESLILGRTTKGNCGAGSDRAHGLHRWQFSGLSPSHFQLLAGADEMNSRTKISEAYKLTLPDFVGCGEMNSGTNAYESCKFRAPEFGGDEMGETNPEAHPRDNSEINPGTKQGTNTKTSSRTNLGISAETRHGPNLGQTGKHAGETNLEQTRN